jgi:hypothetical protein
MRFLAKKTSLCSVLNECVVFLLFNLGLIVFHGFGDDV